MGMVRVMSPSCLISKRRSSTQLRLSCRFPNCAPPSMRQRMRRRSSYGGCCRTTSNEISSQPKQGIAEVNVACGVSAALCRTSLRHSMRYVRSLPAGPLKHSAGGHVQRGRHPIPATTARARGMRTESEEAVHGGSHALLTGCPAHAFCVRAEALHRHPPRMSLKPLLNQA